MHGRMDTLLNECLIEQMDTLLVRKVYATTDHFIYLFQSIISDFQNWGSAKDYTGVQEASQDYD